MPSRKTEGQRLIAAGYSDVFAQMANDCSTWLFWHRPSEGSTHLIINCGTVFFVDAGAGPFGVTASHVLQGLRNAKQKHRDLGIQLGNISFDPSGSLLGEDSARDIATFRISEKTIASLGKKPHVDPGPWLPSPPQESKGVFFGGYRGPGNKLITQSYPVPWDYWHGFGPVTCIFADQLTVRFDRKDWVSQSGRSMPPRRATWGGTSGGPMFSLFESSIVYFRLAGVIKEYSAPVEVMAFSPIDRIRKDGSFVT